MFPYLASCIQPNIKRMKKKKANYFFIINCIWAAFIIIIVCSKCKSKKITFADY